MWRLPEGHAIISTTAENFFVRKKQENVKHRDLFKSVVWQVLGPVPGPRTCQTSSYIVLFCEREKINREEVNFCFYNSSDLREADGFCFTVFHLSTVIKYENI
jgi:hypothetical protein